MATKGWVFVTGASTGIGRATVERLAADGWSVVAGVRRDGDAPPAAEGHVLVDVTDSEQVAAATAEVTERCGGRLAGLVNNAGTTIPGPFEALDLDDWRRQFDINFFGHLDVTRRLLPAILAARGRILTTGSIGGRVASPFLGPYNASKFAIRGWNDALRAELAPQGVHVVLIEPGAIATEIWAKANHRADDLLATLRPDQQQRYARSIAGARKAAALMERNAIPPAKAAAVVAKAMSARQPRPHYLIGVDARFQALVNALPTRAADRVFATIMRPPKDA